MRKHNSEDLLRRLIEGGISPRRARRVVRELLEHRADVVAELIERGDAAAEAQAAADVRLGSDEAWVAQMLARPELQSWARHHPRATFALMPPLAFGLIFVASIFTWVGLFQLLKSELGTLTVAAPALRWAANIANFYMVWGTPVIAATLVAVFAALRRVPPVWPCIGIALICGIGALTNFSVELPPAAANAGMTAGIGISPANAWATFARAAASSTFVILPYLWWYRSRRGVSRRSSVS